MWVTEYALILKKFASRNHLVLGMKASSFLFTYYDVKSEPYLQYIGRGQSTWPDTNPTSFSSNTSQLSKFRQYFWSLLKEYHWQRELFLHIFMHCIEVNASNPSRTFPYKRQRRNYKNKNLLKFGSNIPNQLIYLLKLQFV